MGDSCFFVVRQSLSRNYALSSVKFSALKMGLCKKDDKDQVCRISNMILKGGVATKS